MPIFTLTEFFKKPDNWQIYKQMSSAFYTSNDVSWKYIEKKKLLGRHKSLRNGCWITFFLKNAKVAAGGTL